MANGTISELERKLQLTESLRDMTAELSEQEAAMAQNAILSLQNLQAQDAVRDQLIEKMKALKAAGDENFDAEMAGQLKRLELDDAFFEQNKEK